MTGDIPSAKPRPERGVSWPAAAKIIGAVAVVCIGLLVAFLLSVSADRRRSAKARVHLRQELDKAAAFAQAGQDDKAVALYKSLVKWADQHCPFDPLKYDALAAANGIVQAHKRKADSLRRQMAKDRGYSLCGKIAIRIDKSCNGYYGTMLCSEVWIQVIDVTDSPIEVAWSDFRLDLVDGSESLPLDPIEPFHWRDATLEAGKGAAGVLAFKLPHAKPRFLVYKGSYRVRM